MLTAAGAGAGARAGAERELRELVGPRARLEDSASLASAAAFQWSELEEAPGFKVPEFNHGEEAPEEVHHHGFGEKSIGYFAGCALLVNNITGPGVPALPNVFVESGWLFPTVCILTVWVMTSFSAAMYCEAMRKIPGNEHFGDSIEYTTIVRHYFGRNWYIVCQVGLNGALQSLNIVSVIQSVQVMDSLISAMFGTTCGLNLTPFQNVWRDSTGMDHPVAGSTDVVSCIDTSAYVAGNAWGCHVVLTAGYVLVAGMAIPCGRWNLDDNMVIQTGAFVLTIICWLIWIFASASSVGDLDSPSLPAVNSDPTVGSQAAVLGSILFNFGFVTTVPSWVNEKKPHVSVNRSLWVSTFVCILVFFAVGVSGALAFPNILAGPTSNTCRVQVLDPSKTCLNDFLELFSDASLAPASWKSRPLALTILRGSVYIFPIVAVVSSIPVFSIVIRYNMEENGFSKRFAFLWGVVFPWAFAFPMCYMPNVLAQFVNYTSLVFVSFTDFIVPWALYIVLQRKHAKALESEREAFMLHDAHELDSPQLHNALPSWLGISPRSKSVLAAVMMIALTAASVAATVGTVEQGSNELSSQVCALVGS